MKTDAALSTVIMSWHSRANVKPESRCQSAEKYLLPAHKFQVKALKADSVSILNVSHSVCCSLELSALQRRTSTDCLCEPPDGSCSEPHYLAFWHHGGFQDWCPINPNLLVPYFIYTVSISRMRYSLWTSHETISSHEKQQQLRVLHEAEFNPKSKICVHIQVCYH